ncbi:MAG: hypothetical protein AAGH60_09930 [Pseudomonadota bacterium]
MPSISTISNPIGRLFTAYNQHRARVEEERRTELQFAREMRNRSYPESREFAYYNGIVKRLGGY